MINTFFRINLFWSVLVLFLFSSLLTPTVLAANSSYWIEQDFGTIQSIRGITKAGDVLVAVGNSGSIMTSQDQGESWVLNSNVSGTWWHDVMTETDGDLVAVGESGTYAESSDQGQHWSSLSLGVSAHLYDIDRSSSYGYIVGSSGMILYLANGKWFTASVEVTEPLYAAQDNGDGSAWIVGGGGRVLKAVNGGLSWVNLGRVGTENLQGVYFESSSIGWVIGENGTFKKTTDAGSSWSDVSVEGLVDQDLYDIQVSGDHIVVAGDSVVLLSEDGGVTWILEEFVEEDVTFYTAYYENDSQFWVAGSHDDVFSSVYLYSAEEETLDEEAFVDFLEELFGEEFFETEIGSLIKLSCEEAASVDDPCHAVYYYTNNERHAFPNERVFFTWFENFDEVLEVEKEFMSNIPLGSNVTYHPGTRMVKFQSFSTVYTVSIGGLLRPIASEEIAADLYGENWNQQIDDIPDAFYGNYVFGEPIESIEDYDVEEEFGSVEYLDDNF